MYTRSRQNAAYNNARNQNNQNVGYPMQNYQQGGYQQQSPSNQQGSYKPGNMQNAPGYKTPTPPQMQQSRSMQQIKNQQPMQQQPLLHQSMQQHQQQQSSSATASQPPRLKPILKQPSSSTQQSIPTSVQPVAPSQPTPVPAPASSATLSPAPASTPAPAPGPAPTSISAPVSVPTPGLTLAPTTTSNTVAASQPSPTQLSTPAVSDFIESKANALICELMDTDASDQPKWRRKLSGNKNVNTTRINKRLKRIRLNQRLRKTLQPKNAIMVLNEMKAGVQFTFPETQGTMPNSLYVVHAELGGKTYVGQGLSKPLARQNAAENALKALLLEKMTAATMKARLDAEGESQQLTESGDTTSLQLSENPDETSAMDVDDTTEIPWSSLASFALYKLFLEWHNQGTSVPVPRPGLPSPVKGVKRENPPQKIPMQKELPSNATSIHPVMLLNQMRPGLTYVELNRVGNPPNTMFTLGVEIDGVEYTGTAKNKKDAKKITAKAALLALYGLCYPDESKPQIEQVQLQEVQMG